MLTIKSLSEYLMSKHSGVLKGIAEADVDKLVRSALILIGREIDSSTVENPARVAGLGVFASKQVTKSINGKEVAATRTLFRRISPKKKVKSSALGGDRV